MSNRAPSGEHLMAMIASAQARFDLDRTAALEQATLKAAQLGCPTSASAGTDKAVENIDHTGTLNLPGEAMVRAAGAPKQPPGTRWFTDSGNAAGTAHLYVKEDTGVLVSHCGREILLASRRAEDQGLRYCKRCLKGSERLARQADGNARRASA